MCSWVKNWRQDIKTAAKLYNSLIFETNGIDVFQEEQIKYTKTLYKHMRKLTDSSKDDIGHINRPMLHFFN